MTASLDPSPRVPRADLRMQILLVLGVSLGASAVYSVLDLAEMALRSSIAESSTTLNQPLSPLPVLDALRRLTGICFALVPVALALYLLAGTASRIPAVLRGIGVDARRPGHDAAWGLALFVVMGGGTLGLYQAGRALGITAEITTSTLGVPSALRERWMTRPSLVRPGEPGGSVETRMVSSGTAAAAAHGTVTEMSWGRPETSGAVTGRKSVPACQCTSAVFWWTGRKPESSASRAPSTPVTTTTRRSRFICG